MNVTRIQRNQRADGFTLVEIIIGLALIGVLFAISVPVAVKTIHQAKMSSVGYNCSILVRRAKSEAIKKNSPVVVRYDSGLKLLSAFVDVHGATVNDPPDWSFAPDPTQPPTATDHEVAQCALPAGLSWGGPADDPGILAGFTTWGTEKIAVLQPDGSIEDIGSWRYGDERRNYLAIQIAPTATARVTLLKWDEDTVKWREQDEDGKIWEWF